MRPNSKLKEACSKVRNPCAKGRPLVQKLIDDIYEAAFIPGKWEGVLDQMAGLSNSSSAAILVFSDHYAPRGMVSPALAHIFAQDFVGAGEWKLSVRVKTMLEIQPRGFVLIDDFVAPEDALADPAWLRLHALGMEHQLCTMIPMSSGEHVTFTTERHGRDGPYATKDIALLDGLRPHLARAGLIAARLGLERAQAAVAVLDALGLPAAILRQSGDVMAASNALDTLSTLIMPQAWGGIHIAHPTANALYRETLAQMRSGNLRALRSIPVPAGQTYPAAVIHVLPMRGGARDILAGSEYLMVVSTVQAQVANSSLLNALFDLTSAEARLADRLLTGQSLDDIAVLHGVAITTIRSQLSSIFAKTGTSRQGQLVALLSSLCSPRDH